MRCHQEQEKTVTRRNHREHLRSVHGWPRLPVECPCDLQENRFRKRDAYDCGNTRCGVCHSDKRFGHEPTLDEIRADLELEEYLTEIEERHGDY